MKGKKMIRWNVIINEDGGLFDSEVQSFANGELSGREFYQLVREVGDMEARSAVRQLLRNRGVDEARRLARKALSRR